MNSGVDPLYPPASDAVEPVESGPVANGSNGHASVADLPPEAGALLGECIEIRGARVHNLRNVSVDIPRGKLVVITGLSGSGKSSLAFDTLVAEGQRRYIESLSTYARQFVDQLERPDVDLIEGLQPTLAIDQKAGSQNPRSTVATVTEMYDYLRLLMARVGQAFCYRCDAPIRQQSPEQILTEIMSLPERTKCMILAPYVRGRKGQHQEVFEAIRKAGFVRARVNGQMYDLDAVPELSKQKLHHIEAVVDRVLIREGIRPRVAESLRLTLRHTAPLVMICFQDPSEAVPVVESLPVPSTARTTNGKGKTNGHAPASAAKGKNGNGKSAPPPPPAGKADDGVWHERVFSTEYACPECNLSYEELEPRTFSFNSPYGACPTCEGLGSRVTFDPELVLPDATLSLSDGAIAPWRGGSATATNRRKKLLAEFLSAKGFRWNSPLDKLKPKVLEQLLQGDGKEFAGVLALLEQEFAAEDQESGESPLAAFRGSVPCPDCHGARLRPEARAVRLADKAIHQITAQAVDAAAEFFRGLKFKGPASQIAPPVVNEIVARLEFLLKVGLGYLTLDRAADTLSGGELQRIRLASSLGSGLTGVCYVLDEPSIGLHPRDNERLIDALWDLQQQENTVIVVEHDEAVMRRCHHLIDIGPGAGRHGGTIVAFGTPGDVAANPASITGAYLSGRLSIPVPTTRRKLTAKHSITLEGASTNNLKDVTARFPLGALVCVTGVSGSGKSSLVNETLARAITRKLTGLGVKPGPFTSLRGTSMIDRVVEVDQSPIGRTPRSNPATYAGLFDEIRKVFSTTKLAKLRGYKVGRFSFNVKGGRCEACQGQGVRRIEMNFLPDLWVPCELCIGRRFNRQTLEIRYRGKSIADVLDMRLDEAREFFENYPVIARMLSSMEEVGLGYVALGQSSTTLSGGEAQRIKLATELGRPGTGKTLYILDEPTTGLHFEDVRNLLAVLSRLVDLGNTVICIEHNLDVMKAADWILDMGPEGGAAGGQLLAEGTPEEIAALEGNHTGKFLREALKPVSSP